MANKAKIKSPFTKNELQLIEVAVRLRLESAQENEVADGRSGKAWVKKWSVVLDKVRAIL